MEIKGESIPSASNEVIQALLIRCGHKCMICGKITPFSKGHVVPLKKGKRPEVEDLIYLCEVCYRKEYRAADLKKKADYFYKSQKVKSKKVKKRK